MGQNTLSNKKKPAFEKYLVHVNNYLSNKGNPKLTDEEYEKRRRDCGKPKRTKDIETDLRVKK